jgi:RNA polymerase sigma factor (sigma-70 family)
LYHRFEHLTDFKLKINELHAHAIAGDKNSEKELFSRLTESFIIFAQQRIWDGAEAKEIVQDTLLTISEKYKGIDFETSFSAWAYRILENKIMSYFRTEKSRQEKLKQWKGLSPAVNIEPEFRHRLIDCLKKLGATNSRYARIINLSYQGFGGEEIAEKMGIKKNNVYNILARARTKLKQCLDEGDLT